jgi:hypothetical protein
MDENQHIWIRWARTLQRWGIKDGVASLLETTGSLPVLFAQILYISQPLLSGAVPSRSLDELAQILENPVNRREFISFLREAPTSGSSA